MSDLEQRVSAIEKRNARVEMDKAWETSWERKLILIVVTYVTVGLYMWFIHVLNPWISAVVPTLGFMISTLVFAWIKNIWIKNR
jgi:hypothetical protein